MEHKDYTRDLSEIRELMSRSSQFISLSGISGILAGVYAIVGAFIAKIVVFDYYPNYIESVKSSESLVFIIVDLALVLLLSIATAMILSRKKAKDNNEQIWGETTKRLILNFLIPFLTGGIFTLILLLQGEYNLIAGSMLIFYGLALINASKYTVGTIKYLGIAEVITGLVCLALPAIGFWLWVIGFGALHIIYGALLYREENAHRS